MAQRCQNRKTMSEPRKLKLGVVGVGPIAQIAHLPAISKAENVTLAAACDVSTEMLDHARRLVDFDHAYTDYSRMLEEADIEAVLIPVANEFHAELALMALERGKHVLVEKPLAVTLEECDALLEAVERTGLKLQMACMKRHDPGLQFAQRFTAEEMGPRISLHGWYCDSAHHGTYVRSLRRLVFVSAERKRPETPAQPQESALLYGHGVHLVDTIRFFGGDIVAVSATHGAVGKHHTWHASLEFADGAVGSLELTCIVKMDWFEGLHLHGENGSVVARIPFPYVNRPSEVQVYDARTGEYRAPAAADADPYERQVEAFARAILEDGPLSPDIYEAYQDQQVLAAIEQSAAARRRIEITPPRRGVRRGE
jgi:predicted dehydrogenase